MEHWHETIQALLFYSPSQGCMSTVFAMVMCLGPSVRAYWWASCCCLPASAARFLSCVCSWVGAMSGSALLAAPLSAWICSRFSTTTANWFTASWNTVTEEARTCEAWFQLTFRPQKWNLKAHMWWYQLSPFPSSNVAICDAAPPRQHSPILRYSALLRYSVLCFNSSAQCNWHDIETMAE